MTTASITKLLSRRGTVELMNHYPKHKRQIARAALRDRRPGHGAIRSE